MERYDPGLRIIAAAQQARDAGRYSEAHARFVEGIEQLITLTQTERDERIKGLVRKHIANFMDEAERMKAAHLHGSASARGGGRGGAAVPQRAKMLQATAQGVEKRARDAESGLKFTVAFSSYQEAAAAYKGLRQAAEVSDELRTWAGQRALAMLAGAERMQKFIRGASGPQDDDVLNLPHVPGSAAAEEAKRVPENFATPDPNRPNTLPNSLTETFVRGKTKKNPVEEHVLIVGNKINGRLYERMHATDGDWHNFEGSDFKDPDGQPRMSQKQKDKHGVWARPSQIFGSPTLIKHFTYESITQTLVADCSFVSSLAVCAAWERHTFSESPRKYSL
jgi:calpain-7